MWMPKDTATWLAVIGLILIVPFNFFSSWAYPKLQDWWAARSRKSLQKRIDKLKAALADMYQGHGMSHTDEWILRCAEQLSSLIFWGVNILAALMLFMLAPLLHPIIRHPKVFALVVATIITSYRLLRDYLMAKIKRFRRYAGPIVKLELEESIADLTAKLAAREHRKPT